MNNYETVELLSNAFGPSGFEDEVSEIIQGLVEPLVDELRSDALGNLIVTKRGASERVGATGPERRSVDSPTSRPRFTCKTARPR